MEETVLQQNMQDTILQLEKIEKSFGETRVLQGISLAVRRGEFVTLLGPSGCGKTTTLRIIAGLEDPDAGRVLLDGQDVTMLPPNRRNVNTVFQNYALFPHMNVEANIAYSLKLKRTPKKQMHETVAQVLELVQLPGYEKRMPSELSGGQRQRVAIARALVNNPHVLLLDEPLGALDYQLRRQMQHELKRLQKQLGITFIYITHDQEEAINMSDRIAVMRDGRLIQLGTPAEVYHSPRTAFVAEFVGNANVLRGTLCESEGALVRVALAGGSAWARRQDGILPAAGERVALAVRSENIEILPEEGEQGLLAEVREKAFAGGMLRITLALQDGSELSVSRHGIDSNITPGQRVRATWPGELAVLVDEA